MNKIKEYKKLLPEELEKRIADNYKILKKIWEEDDGNSYDKYREKCKPYREDNFALYTALVLIMDRIDIDTEPLPEEDKKCLIPIKEFAEACKFNMITSWDGDGVYATENEITKLDADPEAFKLGYYRKDFTHVCWYNK